MRGHLARSACEAALRHGVGFGNGFKPPRKPQEAKCKTTYDMHALFPFPGHARAWGWGQRSKRARGRSSTCRSSPWSGASAAIAPYTSCRSGYIYT
jgi:hypothetical protein